MKICASCVALAHTASAQPGARLLACSIVTKHNVALLSCTGCGHCKKLAPAWGELADAFARDDSVVIGHVDCTVHKDACQDVSCCVLPVDTLAVATWLRA